MLVEHVDECLGVGSLSGLGDRILLAQVDTRRLYLGLPFVEIAHLHEPDVLRREVGGKHIERRFECLQRAVVV